MPKDPSSQSFTDTLIAGFGDAVADIRHKLVKSRGMVVKPPPTAPMPNRDCLKPFEEYVGQNENPSPEQVQDKGQEQDLER